MRLAPGTELVAKALLFDMDGTLVDSRAGVERLWREWCAAHHLNFAEVKPHLHGVRLADNVRRFTPAGYDVEQEVAAMYRAELEDADSVIALPGTRELLASLPPECWTIVTSADHELARARLRAADVSAPPKMVGGNDVSVGKPDPQGYLEAARRMGCRPDQTLIFEDAAAGIAAGMAAGGRVIGIASGDPGEFAPELEWVENLASLEFADFDGTDVRLRVIG